MGRIFDIQRFCIHDGPGIRTTVFLKGCPLRCAWCHNPEGLEPFNQVMYYFEKCISCGVCSEICGSGAHSFKNGIHLFDTSKCTSCMKCTNDICPAEALKPAGCEISVDDIMKTVLRDKCFFDESKGGITISGGEPFLQPNFAIEILKAAKKEGLHTAVETSGATSENIIKSAASFVDLFLYDYKITGEEEHKKYTGVSQTAILHNLNVLNSLNSNIILRCPVIPGINTNEKHYKAIGNLTKELKNIKKVNVMPYHSIGVGKYEKIGMSPPFSTQTMNYKSAIEIKEKIQQFSSVEVEVI